MLCARVEEATAPKTSQKRDIENAWKPLDRSTTPWLGRNFCSPGPAVQTLRARLHKALQNETQTLQLLVRALGTPGDRPIASPPRSRAPESNSAIRETPRKTVVGTRFSLRAGARGFWWHHYRRCRRRRRGVWGREGQACRQELDDGGDESVEVFLAEEKAGRGRLRIGRGGGGGGRWRLLFRRLLRGA